MQGTRKYCPVITADRGYDHYQKNIDWRRVTLLREFCKENHCIFLTPGSSRSETIHQWDPKIKKIREVEIPEGGEDLIKSYQLLVGMFRYIHLFSYTYPIHSVLFEQE